jgi:preprotein translocase subunit YajC
MALCRLIFKAGINRVRLVEIQTLASITWLFAAADGGGGDLGPLGGLPMVMLVIFALFYLMVIRPQRAKERDFKALLNNLKKNDRVVTIGGIHGVVTNFQKEADRVTIRVDETTGTTLRVGLSAIARVLTDEEESSEKGLAGKK